MNNFAELSGCVFSWIEEQCKPVDLQEMMGTILRQVQNFEDEDQHPDPAYQNIRLNHPQPSRIQIPLIRISDSTTPSLVGSRPTYQNIRLNHPQPSRIQTRLIEYQTQPPLAQQDPDPPIRISDSTTPSLVGYRPVYQNIRFNHPKPSSIQIPPVRISDSITPSLGGSRIRLIEYQIQPPQAKQHPDHAYQNIRFNHPLAKKHPNHAYQNIRFNHPQQSKIQSRLSEYQTRPPLAK